MSNPTITFKPVADSNGSPSYFDISVTGSTYSWISTGSVLDAWCLDPNLPLSGLKTFTSVVYSSNEISSISANVRSISATVLGHLDEMNWLYGYYESKVDPTLTYGDVQAAIWQMSGFNWSAEAPYLGAYDTTRINNLVSMALTHDGYVPMAGAPLALVLDPITTAGAGNNQPIIVVTKAAALGDFVWADTNANVGESRPQYLSALAGLVTLRRYRRR